MTYTPSPAGFWKRYVAYFIDILILYIAVEILSLLFFSFQAQSEVGVLMDLLKHLESGSQSGEMPDLPALMQQIQTALLPALVFSTLAFFILGIVYFSAMEASPQQATVGKRMLGIKVTNVAGGPITLTHAVARYMAASLSWITLNIGHALAAWTPARRTLHDYVAGTRVENVDPDKPGMPLWAWVVVIAHGLFFVGSCLLMAMMMWLMMQQLAAI